MSAADTIVLDASVGVKWFKPEPGRASALELLDRGIRGDARLVAPVHFAHEVLAVVRRHYSPADVVPAWQLLEGSGITLVPLDGDGIAAAARQCESLGCSFYDSLAPALATMLDAELWSADRAAHARYPGVRLIGESIE